MRRDSTAVRPRWTLRWFRGSSLVLLAPQPPRLSEDVEGPELHRDPRPGVRDLGDGVLPRALAGAAHHDQVAVAHLDHHRVGAAQAGAEVQLARIAERDDRDHRVGGLAAADGVAVPG